MIVVRKLMSGIPIFFFLIFTEHQLKTLNYLVHHMIILVNQDSSSTHNFRLNNRAVLRFGVHKKDFMATKVLNNHHFFLKL